MMNPLIFKVKCQFQNTLHDINNQSYSLLKININFKTMMQFNILKTKQICSKQQNFKSSGVIYNTFI